MKLLSSLFLFLSLTALGKNDSFKTLNNSTENDYLEKTLVVKFKDEYRNQCAENKVSIASFQTLFSRIDGELLHQRFPQAEKPTSLQNKYGYYYADLTLIYEFKYNKNVSLAKIISQLYQLGIVEYAEPHYIYKTFYTPNDAQIGSQSHLNIINAYNAWNVTKGDTNVVISIIDSGWDTDHEDLQSEIKRNYNDPIDGIDNDNDGYIDNYNGWDFVDNDNNPQATAFADHGVQVAGCASPTTDNGIGVAGPGFNCKLLPVKVGSGTTIVYGYDGITYAADHNADIINCSWGGPFASSLGQDVVTYATINKDALVIVSAGNDNNNTPNYPAAYSYALSVAATNNNDTKASYSSYEYSVDISAPGNIYTTKDGGGYTWNQGTSFSAPVTSGGAGLVKSQFPNYTALQIGAQLKASADDISALNNAYANQLGAGRLNLFGAVSAPTKPEIEMNNELITDSNNEIFVVGDTISISGDFINLLAPATNVVATMSSTSNYIEFYTAAVNLGDIATLQTVNNNTTPFQFSILPNTPYNASVTLKINITDGTDSWLKVITLTINSDYINIAINDVATSITSKGRIGYNLENQAEGIGFTYKDNGNLLWDASLLIGIDGKVVDMARNSNGGSDNDFSSAINVAQLSVPVFSEFDATGKFTDASGGTDKIGLQITHNAYAWTTQGHRKYVIVEYTITNNSNADLSDLYAGIFADWDIGSDEINRANSAMEKKLGYCYDIDDAQLYAGAQLLTDGGFATHAMLNSGNNGVNPNTSFTSSDKYTGLSTPNPAEGDAAGADVSMLVNSGPHTILQGDSIKVAFALLAGDNLSDLKQTADSAYLKYNGIALPAAISEIENNTYFNLYPNPTSNFCTITFSSSSPTKIQLITITGQVLKTIYNSNNSESMQTQQLDLTGITAGIYFVELQTGTTASRKKLIIQ